jgi:hypothetical protein
MSKNEGPDEGLRDAMLAMVQSLAAEGLVRMVREGGDRAERTLRSVLRGTGQADALYRRRNGQLAKDLEYAQASIRAMVGQTQPEDVRVPIDPPAGHQWTSGRPEAPGRLVCITCTGGKYGGPNETQAPVVLAAECLERARVAAADVHEDSRLAGDAAGGLCGVCGMVH